MKRTNQLTIYLASRSSPWKKPKTKPQKKKKSRRKLGSFLRPQVWATDAVIKSGHRKRISDSVKITVDTLQLLVCFCIMWHQKVKYTTQVTNVLWFPQCAELGKYVKFCQILHLLQKVSLSFLSIHFLADACMHAYKNIYVPLTTVTPNHPSVNRHGSELPLNVKSYHLHKEILTFNCLLHISHM